MHSLRQDVQAATCCRRGKSVVKVLVCGGRTWNDRGSVSRVLSLLRPTEVIHGAASGADQLARDWALHNQVLIRQFPADWAKHGKAAGPMRNQRMLDESKPDVVVAFPGGRGTADMVRRAKAAGVRVMEPCSSGTPKENL